MWKKINRSLQHYPAASKAFSPYEMESDNARHGRGKKIKREPRCECGAWGRGLQRRLRSRRIVRPRRRWRGANGREARQAADQVIGFATPADEGFDEQGSGVSQREVVSVFEVHRR